MVVAPCFTGTCFQKIMVTDAKGHRVALHDNSRHLQTVQLPSQHSGAGPLRCPDSHAQLAAALHCPPDHRTTPAYQPPSYWVNSTCFMDHKSNCLKRGSNCCSVALKPQLARAADDYQWYMMVIAGNIASVTRQCFWTPSRSQFTGFQIHRTMIARQPSCYLPKKYASTISASSCSHLAFA